MRPIRALALALLLAPPAAATAQPLRVAATFSVLADMTREVGGERVSVRALVGPGGDVHAYRPTPSDAALVGGADVLVINGGGLEGWLARLAAASGFRGLEVIATRGIALRPAARAGAPGHAHDHEGETLDPHAWHDPANALVYVRNIRAALAERDPAGAPVYRARAARYAETIRALDARARLRLGAIPPERRRAISAHGAFAYLGAAYGIEFLSPVGVSTSARPSARDLATLVREARARRVAAVFLEGRSDPRLSRRIAAESGIGIGGTLYAGSLSAADGQAPTYLRMMEHNVRVLAEALDAAR